MSQLRIYNCNCLDYLLRCENGSYNMIFADPPDNIKTKYETFHDDMLLKDYYTFLHSVLVEAIRVSPLVWFSYNQIHDLEIKYMIRQLQRHFYPTLKARTIIWRYTFGQNTRSDFASGFRPILRLKRYSAKFYPTKVKVTSYRMEIHDPRADPTGRVPDDVWEFPRVVGNAHERRSWHPTQHPEAVIKRIMNFSMTDDDKMLDLFAGSGTTTRVARKLDRNCDACEVVGYYCRRIVKENPTCELCLL
jgi:DNA modification methylase